MYFWADYRIPKCSQSCRDVSARLRQSKDPQWTQKKVNKVYKSEFREQKTGAAKKKTWRAPLFSCFHAMENTHLLEDTSWKRLVLGHPDCFILHKQICEGNPEKLATFLNSFDTSLEWQQTPIRMWSQLFLGEISHTFGWQAHLRLFFLFLLLFRCADRKIFAFIVSIPFGNAPYDGSLSRVSLPPPVIII